MKGVIVAIVVAASASQTLAVVRPEEPKPVLARVTVYWASGGKGSDRYTRHHKSATGGKLKDGHCAVDPKKIPYGSSVILPDGTRLSAVDTGTAVRNRKAARLLGKTALERNALVIDRFFETKKQALAWANSHPHFVPVQIVEPGSTIPRLTAVQPMPPSTPKAVAQNRTVSHNALQLPKIH